MLGIPWPHFETAHCLSLNWTWKLCVTFADHFLDGWSGSFFLIHWWAIAAMEESGLSVLWLGASLLVYGSRLIWRFDDGFSTERGFYRIRIVILWRLHQNILVVLSSRKCNLMLVLLPCLQNTSAIVMIFAVIFQKLLHVIVSGLFAGVFVIQLWIYWVRWWQRSKRFSCEAVLFLCHNVFFWRKRSPSARHFEHLWLDSISLGAICL